MVNANIMDSLQGNILGSESPFRWSDLGGDYSFHNNGSVLKLKNTESYALRSSTWGVSLQEVSDNSGWVHFIVKNNVEIDVRIWTNRNGYFQGINDNPSYNLEVDSNVFSEGLGNADSFIQFTMRGNGMLSLDVNGDKGAHHITGSEFDTLSRTWHNLPRPNGDSFLAVLTYPDGLNGSTVLRARTLDYNSAEQAFWIEITGARRFTGGDAQAENWDGLSDDLTGNSGAITGGIDLNTPDIIDATDWSLVVTREYPNGIVVTEQTGHDSSWTVKMLQRNVGTTDQYDLGQNEYAVFIDGVIQTNSVSNDLMTTLNKFNEAVSATRTYWNNYEPTVKEPIVTNPLPSFDDVKLGLGVGFGAIAIILILIILARR
tara:strand:+ start:131 stop:1249 length:1119 start_codon:yes stop_codon:yes gene_type:complete